MAASIGLQMVNGDKLIKQLEKIAEQVRERISRQALEESTEPVEAAVIAYAPDSDLTGSRDKQSADTKKKWARSRKLNKTIKSVVRTRRRAGVTAGMLALVGPSYSDGGGHGNFFSKDHERMVLWGVDAGNVRRVNQFVKRAADESKDIALNVLVMSAKAGIDLVARNTTNG